MLSEAKRLSYFIKRKKQILRCAQDDIALNLSRRVPLVHHVAA